MSISKGQDTCSAYCDYYFDGTSNGLGCTDQTSSGCTHCFTELFSLSGSTCALRTDVIYNSTSEVSLTGWAENNSANTFLTFNTPAYTVSFQLMRFSQAALAAVNYTIPSTGHYGIRCRFWYQLDDVPNNRMYFYINSSHEYHLVQNFSDSSFSSKAAIFTTDYIPYTDNIIQFAFKRNDSQGSGDPTGFSQLIVFIAECVPGCSSCTNLTDCSACTGSTYLNPLTNLCENSCPSGMFISVTPNLCDLCDKMCL